MKVLAIALNTFKEAVRNRILYVLLFFAILILLGAWVVSNLSIFGQEKIMRDLGVGAINLISVLIAVFVGVGLVYNDLDKKTIYTIVSKPISRWHFLVGKYLGLLLTIFLNIILMTFFFLVVLYFRSYTTDDAIDKALMTNADGTMREIGALEPLMYYLVSAVKSIGQGLMTVFSLGMYHTPVTSGIMQVSFLTMMEMSIITAFSVLFSSFSSPTLSAFMTVIMFVIGRANEDLYFYADLIARNAGGVEQLSGGKMIAHKLIWFCSHVAPNLEVFNQREAVSQMQIPDVTMYSVAYGIAYTAAVLIIATMVFNRRNFK